MVGGFINWYFRINPVYFLFFYTVGAFTSYIASNFYLLTMFGIAVSLQFFWTFSKLFIHYDRQSNSNIKELYGEEDEEVDHDIEWFQKRIEKPEIRKSLKNHTVATAFLSLLIGLVALYLWTIQNYIVSILLILLLVVLCFRIFQAGYILMKN